jgi:hypothetical protein
VKTVRKSLALSFIVVLLIVQTFSTAHYFAGSYAQNTNSSVYVGVDIAYGATTEAKAEIDQIGSYTNLVVFGSTQVTWFQDRVNETFQYAYDKGLSIISLRPTLMQYSSTELNETEWYPMAQNRWGNRLLGFYIMDEPGGRQLDGTQTYTWNNATGYPSSFSDAANRFTSGISNFLNSQRPPSYLKTFTSDYALYWYDYKAGYDTVWTELGGNNSQQINIALCRAASQANNKEWGAIITWSYTNFPYIENGTQLYDDMRLAYDNGAKYIIVFDSDEKGHSILQAEHLDAIQRFWTYAQDNQPRSNYPKIERTAFVLPNAYGFGFRWPTDHIWGLWEANDLTANISLSVGTLLKQYGEKLDIIFDDGLQQGNNGYNQLFYWNSYDPTPSPSPTPTPTPTASPTPSSSPINPPEQHFTTTLLIAVAIASVVVTSVGITVYFKKHNQENI